MVEEGGATFAFSEPGIAATPACTGGIAGDVLAATPDYQTLVSTDIVRVK